MGQHTFLPRQAKSEMTSLSFGGLSLGLKFMHMDVLTTEKNKLQGGEIYIILPVSNAEIPCTKVDTAQPMLSFHQVPSFKWAFIWTRQHCCNGLGCLQAREVTGD